MTRGRIGVRGMGIVRIVLLALLFASPANGEESAAGRPAGIHQELRKKIALSLKIAEAKNRKTAGKYYRSLARQHRMKFPGRDIPDSGKGKNRAGEGTGDAVVRRPATFSR